MIKTEWTNKDNLSIETTGCNSKAVLVIDMPTDCIKCPLADGYCWNIFPTKGIADGCPLRLLPREWTMDEVEPGAYNEGFVDGVNYCIYSITGDTE